jgi:GDP-L-fucose synthase
MERIAETVNFRGRIAWDATKPAGQPRGMLDASRAERDFRFKARVPFEEGLRKTF